MVDIKEECKDCPYRVKLEEETEKTRKLQEKYLMEVDSANKTVLKYTQKIDEIEQNKKS